MESDNTPTASTSSLPPPAAQSPPPPPADVKGTKKRRRSPDPKGKAKQEDDGDPFTASSSEPADGNDTGEDKPGAPLDPEEDILMATVPKANIVGLKYARGIATLKESMDLDLRRDPYNVSDKNAIEVRHFGGQRIGFMAKQLSARLAPLIKERKIYLKAKSGPVPSNIVGLVSVPMAVQIWGKRKFSTDERLDWAFPERQKKRHEASEQRRAMEDVRREEMDEDEREIEGEGRKGGKKGGEGKGKGKGDGKATNGSAGPNGTTDDLIKQSIRLETRKGSDMLGDMFKAGELDPAHLPSHPCPPGKKDGSMRSNLLEFQKQGLAWMIRMEHPELPRTQEDKPVQLWTRKADVEGKTFWHNIATGKGQREKPALARGGILADEMGLGKTMQTIALICTDDTGEGVLDEPEDPDDGFDDMTLIVCPLSVASNWTDQFAQHVGKKRLKWHLYHGEGRDLTKKQLRQYDVIITTYHTLAGALDDEPDGRKKPRKKGADDDDVPLHQVNKKAKKADDVQRDKVLHTIRWRRVVLDEGHVIKNPKAKMSKACAELKAERRWVLTGTPIVNAAGDLGAMLQFLRMCKPLNDPVVWRQYVGKGGQEAAALLRAVVLSTTLRRTKDMVDASGQPLIRLPEVAFYQHKVQLKPAARELYAEVEKEVAESVKAAKKGGAEKLSYTHILCLLLRLRQLACDPTLCPQDFISDIRDRNLASRIQEEHDKAAGSRSGGDQLAFLRDLLRDAQDEDCMACGGLMAEPRITICQHVFCQSCIDTVIESAQPCPQCSWPLKPDEVIEPAFSERDPSPSSSYTRASSVGTSRGGSVALAERTAKTEALVGLLKATPKGVKSLVFSQWTSHLDRIEAALAEEGIATCRFDGAMRQEKREEVIKLFTAPNKAGVAGAKEDKKNPMVMLLSLKAGALGLNLTVASQVFLMDPWWQPAIEQQAIDRVNRIGQTKDVRVFQLVAENTVESRVLEIQAKKEKLIAQAFSGSTNVPKATQKLESKLDDIAAIFGIVDSA
ncbi:hypothetical protein JCM10207_005958 [Rhodosporidiobolus poonsookiae]